MHTHLGSQAFFVISGELGQRTPHGVAKVPAGQTMNEREGGMTMQVFSSGSTDLKA